jgi:hypothetical protein
MLIPFRYIQTTTYATTAAAVGRPSPGLASGLGAELPFNVHLLALYTQDYFNFTQFSAHPSAFAAAHGVDAKTSRVLVRLQHIFEEGESVKYATPVEVNLDALLNLAGWKLTNVTEMNLTANRAKADVQKLKWLTRGSLTTVLLSRTRTIAHTSPHHRTRVDTFCGAGRGRAAGGEWGDGHGGDPVPVRDPHLPLRVHRRLDTHSRLQRENKKNSLLNWRLYRGSSAEACISHSLLCWFKVVPRMQFFNCNL